MGIVIGIVVMLVLHSFHFFSLSVELNMSRLSGTGSSSSLNGSSSGGAVLPGADGPASRVVSWAVCFERLLEDPVGVRYFTAFLKSEVSDENILFWQACEKFQKIPATNLDELKREARSIYDLYLSEASFSAVNIDDTARTAESDLEKPTPDMFSKAQQQIFKLMKFDSYARFVRSPLYQNCMLASVEGRPLPDLQPQNRGSRECITSNNNDRKSMEVNVSLLDSKANKKKRREVEKRGSWGADVSYRRVTVSRQESQISVKSNSSVELGSLSSRFENGSSSPVGSDQDSAVRADKYCCVYLPDGTASVAPARAGLSLREMLSGLCEKRGFPLKDVIIYLQGIDKVRYALACLLTDILHLSEMNILQNLSLLLMQMLVSPEESLALSEIREVFVSGLVEMLNRAQCSRVDDQRGLLTKEQLELPQFLQLPDEECACV
uniref:Regulator of G protein signaling 14a n=1 Tax=Astyanax mexicanus TaxID=7994 RepID=A0A8B9LYS6_ASTMX